MGLRPPEEPESARDRRRGPSRAALLAVAAACACACALFGWAAWSYASAPAPAADVPSAIAEAAPGDGPATDDAAASDAPAAADAEQPGAGALAAGGDAPAHGGATSAPGASGTSGHSAGHGDAPAAQGSPEAPQAPAPDDGLIRVTVLLDASTAGGPSRSASVTLARGATAYDALLATGAAVSARPSPFGTYVTSVDGLAAGERGGESGWKYSVDGTVPNVACSSFSLSDGQSVRWYYALRAND